MVLLLLADRSGDCEELGAKYVGSGCASLGAGVPEGPPCSGIPKMIHSQLGLRFMKWRASDCLVFTGFQTALSRYSSLGVASRWANILI